MGWVLKEEEPSRKVIIVNLEIIIHMIQVLDKEYCSLSAKKVLLNDFSRAILTYIV